MALIALMSIIVISLVVWLIVLFLSITSNIEKGWLEKLTSLHAPIKITPTQEYFSSHHYLIDTISKKAGYTPRTIQEKISNGDPYDPKTDETPPLSWKSNGSHKDPVQAIHEILTKVSQKNLILSFQDFEISGALLQLQLIRPSGEGTTKQILTTPSYLTSFADRNPYLEKHLLPPSSSDVKTKTLWPYKIGSHLVLPTPKNGCTGVILAKKFYDNGVRIGDTGFLSYTSMQQEQQAPIVVSGFYNPGIISIGNNYILTHPTLIHLINTSSLLQPIEKTASVGFFVWIKNIKHATALKTELIQLLKQENINQYWKVSTYEEFDFAKEILQQFQSDKNLFLLVGIIILLVACSNIISLLVILVHDKKKEIGILQALGSTKKSITCIFCGVGASLGIVGSIFGICGAIITLHYLESLMKILNFFQGQQTILYTDTTPSYPAILFVLITTPLLSIAAAIIPTLKACRLSPSAILRSE